MNMRIWTLHQWASPHAPKSTYIKNCFLNSVFYLFISNYLIIFVRFLWFVLFSIFTVKNGNPAQFSSNWGGQKILTSGWLPVTFRLVYGEFHKMSHTWVLWLSHWNEKYLNTFCCPCFSWHLATFDSQETVVIRCTVSHRTATLFAIIKTTWFRSAFVIVTPLVQTRSFLFALHKIFLKWCIKYCIVKSKVGGLGWKRTVCKGKKDGPYCWKGTVN